MDAVVDHAVHIWSELRIVREYTKQQTEALLKMREIYLTCFDTTPDGLQDTVFAMDKEHKVPTITKQQCDEKLKALMRRVLVDNPLSPFVNDIVVTVQEYFRLRYSGIKKVSFYVNDPRSLMCIILLEYIHVVLKSDRSQELILGIQRWVKFFKQVRIQNVFPVREAVTNAADTIYAMLLNIEHKLECIMEYVHAEVKERSIGEHLDNLTMIGRNVVDSIFIYLAHALSGQPTPILSVGSFHNPIMASSMQDWLAENYHAGLLAALASNPSVTKLIGVIPSAKPYGANLTTFMSNECAPNELDIDMYSKCRNTAQFFRQDRAINAAVLRTFGYVAVLSELLLCCKEASFLAKMIGEILLCWNEVASRILTGLMSTVREVLRLIKTDMQIVTNELQKTHMRLTQKLGKIDDEEAWKVNYRVVTAMEHAVLELDKVGKMDQICLIVQQHLSNPDSRVRETKERLGVFINNVQEVFTRVKWLPHGDELLRLTDSFAVQLPSVLSGHGCGSPRAALTITAGLPQSVPQSIAIPTHGDESNGEVSGGGHHPSGGEQRSSTDNFGPASPKNTFTPDPQFQRLPIDLSAILNIKQVSQWVFTTVGHTVAVASFRNRCADVILFKRTDGSRVGTLRAGDRSILQMTWLSEVLLEAHDGEGTYVWDIIALNLVFMTKGIAHVNHHHQLYIYSKLDGTRRAAELFNTRSYQCFPTGPGFTWNPKTSTLLTKFDVTPSSSNVITGSMVPRVALADNIVHWQQCFSVWDTSTQAYEPLHITPSLKGIVDARFISSHYFYLQSPFMVKIYDVTSGLEWYSKITAQPIGKIFVIQQWLVLVESPIPQETDFGAPTSDRDSSSRMSLQPDNQNPRDSSSRISLGGYTPDYAKVWLIDVRKKREHPVPFPAQYVSMECTMDGKLITLLASGKLVMFPLF